MYVMSAYTASSDVANKVEKIRLFFILVWTLLIGNDEGGGHVPPVSTPGFDTEMAKNCYITFVLKYQSSMLKRKYIVDLKAKSCKAMVIA